MGIGTFPEEACRLKANAAGAVKRELASLDEAQAGKERRIEGQKSRIP
jgi:hypothetical protein